MKSVFDRKVVLYLAFAVALLYSFWPVMIMGLEGYDTDISPLFSGQGIRFVGGVPTYSGGIHPTPIHYIDALTLYAFPRLVGNTVLISAISIAVALAAGLGAAYALARVPIRGRGVVSFLLLALRTVSPFVAVVPLYVFYTQNGLWDTYFGVALAEDILILSVVVWMLRGFFADIPREVYEAAAVFGATEWQTFRRVALRMVVPGLVVTCIFAFVLIWNEFIISDILTGGTAKTVAVGVWTGLGESSAAFRTIAFDDLSAGGFLAWLPAIAVMLAIRRYLAKGYSLGTASSD